MKKITGNEPAMPLPVDSDNEMRHGLTIRQHYAGLAMQGLASAISHDRAVGKSLAEAIAAESVLLADALISELNKPTP